MSVYSEPTPQVSPVSKWANILPPYYIDRYLNNKSQCIIMKDILLYMLTVLKQYLQLIQVFSTCVYYNLCDGHQSFSTNQLHQPI